MGLDCFYVIKGIIIDLLKLYLKLGKAVLIFMAMCKYIMCSKISPFVTLICLGARK